MRKLKCKQCKSVFIIGSVAVRCSQCGSTAGGYSITEEKRSFKDVDVHLGFRLTGADGIVLTVEEFQAKGLIASRSSDSKEDVYISQSSLHEYQIEKFYS